MMIIDITLHFDTKDKAQMRVLEALTKSMDTIKEDMEEKIKRPENRK